MEAATQHAQLSPAKAELEFIRSQEDVQQSGCDQGEYGCAHVRPEAAAEATVQASVSAVDGSAADTLNKAKQQQLADGAAADILDKPEQKQLAQPNPQQADDTAASAPPRRVCLDWVEAAKADDALELRRLLRAWPSLLNQQVGGLQCTAAHWAAANGHADALQHLLEWGADITVQTATCCLPLHSAAAAGRAECVQQLLVACPDLQQQQLAALNEDGLTAAALALRHGHKMVHGLLLQAAAQGGASSAVQQEGTACAPQQQQQQQGKQSGMRRGFLLSAQAESIPQVQDCISTDGPCPRGAATTHQLPTADTAAGAEGTAALAAEPCGRRWDSTVDNPLYGVASSPIKQPAHQHPVPLSSSRLAPAAAAVDSACAGVPAPNQDAPPPAGTAAVPTESRVPAQGAQQQQDLQQPTPAAEVQQQQAVIERSTGRSWLDAARAGDLPVLQSLLQQQPQLLNYRGAGISYAFVGNSALHWAAAKGHKACVVWLLQRGAAVGAVNEAGASVLHTAVEHGQAGCAEVLVLAGGADLQVQDGYGQSVLSIAGARAGGGSRTGGVVRAEQLLLWDEARKLQQQDRWVRFRCCNCFGC